MLQFFCCVELIDDRSDHIGLAALEKFYQIPSTGSCSRIQSGVGECGGNLPVQLFSVSDNNNFRVAGGQLHQEIFRQHHHGQAFAAALGVPDYTALAIPSFIRFLDGLTNLFDGKILLVTANLLHIGVKEDKIADQLQYSAGMEERDHAAILLGGRFSRQVTLQSLPKESGILLFPNCPELLWRAGGGVFYSVLISGHHDLSKLVKLGNIVPLLVTHGLFYSLLHTDLGRFTFDYSKGDAVEEHNQVRSSIVELISAFHGKFLCHVEDIVLRVFPIHIL